MYKPGHTTTTYAGAMTTGTNQTLRGTYWPPDTTMAHGFQPDAYFLLSTHRCWVLTWTDHQWPATQEPQ